MRVKHNHVKFNKDCSICTLLKEFNNEEGELTDDQHEFFCDFTNAMVIHRRRLLRSVNATIIKSEENEFQTGVAIATMNLLLRK